MNNAYITGTGSYLPGDPVDNEELKARFDELSPRDARLRDRTLAANGIRTRHYAVDEKGQTLMLNEELAAHAISRALADRGLGPEAVRMLATGTTQGDCLVPGFASMVHGRLGGGPMERCPPPACARRAWRRCAPPSPPCGSASIQSPSRPAPSW